METPRVTEDERKQAIDLVAKIYGSPEGGAGCCLHIVLDDNNLDDGSVKFCEEYATENNHPDCIALCRLLAKMKRTQRGKIAQQGTEIAFKQRRQWGMR